MLILKIIGILLAVLLGLLVFVMLMVLFVPVRYRLAGSRLGEPKEIRLKGRISWLLSIVSITFGYEQDPYVKVRLLGIPLKIGRTKNKAKYPDDAAAITEPEAQKTTSAEDKMPILSSDSSDEKNLTVKMAEIPDKGDILREEKSETDHFSEADRPFENSVISEKDSFSRKPQHILQMLRDVFKKIAAFFCSLPQKFSDLERSLREAGKTAEKWYQFVNRPEVKEAIRLAGRQLKKVFCHIRPQRLKISGRFGFSDPALTGHATGFMSMLPFFYGKDISVIPDFSGACLEGEFFLRGRIRAVSLLITALQLWFDSNFKKAYKRFRKMQA